jgi:hypothetical protein
VIIQPVSDSSMPGVSIFFCGKSTTRNEGNEERSEKQCRNVSSGLIFVVTHAALTAM